MARKNKESRVSKEPRKGLGIGWSNSRGKGGVNETQSIDPITNGINLGGLGAKTHEQHTGQSYFGDSINISDNAIGDIPSEKEQRRRRKGKNLPTIGEKYGGKRKWVLVLVGIMILALLIGMMNWGRINSKMGKADAEAIIEEKIKNTTDTGFPTGEASMWVEQFIRIYGTWDYKTASARASDLSPYLAPGLDSQAGWDGQGTQSVIYSAVSNTPEIIDSQRAVFTTSYQIQDGTWRCEKVSVFAYKPTSEAEGPTDQWGFAVTANPTPVPCALRVSVPEFADNKFKQVDDDSANSLKEQFFPGFFSAWVSSDADTLRQFMAPNVTTFGLGGAYKSDVNIVSVVLPINDGQGKAESNTKYNAYVTVQLTDRGGAKTTATYKVPVVSNGTQWQVVGEPEAIVQNLTGVGGSQLADSEGKVTADSEEAKESKDKVNSYASPSAVTGADNKDENLQSK